MCCCSQVTAFINGCEQAETQPVQNNLQTAERDIARLQERATKHAQELQQASLHAVHDLEAKIQQMQGKLDQAQQQFHALKAQYGQQETLAECSRHLEGLQRDLSVERQKMKQLAGKGQEVADAKQEAVQANKNLQVPML